MPMSRRACATAVSPPTPLALAPPASARAAPAGSATSKLQPLARFYDNFMLFNDAPRHTRLRRLFAPAFGPDAVRRWEACIEALVEELLNS